MNFTLKHNMKGYIKNITNPFFRCLIFNPACLVDMQALFEITLISEPKRFPEKPFRSLIPMIGDKWDPYRKIEENLRHQMSFFILVTLFHQVGDSFPVLEDHRFVKLAAFFYDPENNLKQGEEKNRPLRIGASVESLTRVLKAFCQRYNFSPCQLGKIKNNFVAFSLQNMYPHHKQPSQYSKKINKELFTVYSELNPENPKTPSSVELLEMVH